MHFLEFSFPHQQIKVCAEMESTEVLEKVLVEALWKKH